MRKKVETPKAENGINVSQDQIVKGESKTAEDAVRDAINTFKAKA